MKDKIFKIGFCVAYDWELLKKAIPVVYEKSDLICLSLDINRVSWSGKKFEFDDSSFFEYIKEIDVSHKIEIYQDNFFIPTNTPMENETRQRNLISKYMGENGWHIQFDVDEYMINYSLFLDYLRKLDCSPSKNSKKKITVRCPWIVLFKQLDEGFLLIDNDQSKLEFVSIATNYPVYSKARNTETLYRYTHFFIIHESWARSKNQILEKINNWGHSNEIASVSDFVNFWENLSPLNFQNARNFHPVKPHNWQRLKFVKSSGIETAIELLRNDKAFKINRLILFFRNFQLRKILRIK